MSRIRRLSPNPVVVFKSPSPRDIFAYSPGIIEGTCGRLIATFDLGGPGAERLPGAVRSCDGWSQGKNLHFRRQRPELDSPRGFPFSARETVFSGRRALYYRTRG